VERKVGTTTASSGPCLTPPFWRGHGSTNYSLQEMIIMGADRYRRQHYDISFSRVLSLAVVPWWQPSSDLPSRECSSAMTEASSNSAVNTGHGKTG